MRLLVGILMLFSGLEAQAQLDASQISPGNLPVIWQCKGKYSGREINIRAQLADFNPLLYIESPGLNVFVRDENSIMKPVWKSQGGVHLCVASENGGARAMHFLKIADNLLNPRNASNSGEYQRYPKYEGPSNCDGIRGWALFDQSEYLSCNYTGTNLSISDYTHSGSLTGEQTSFSQAPNISDIKNLKIRQANSSTFVLANGDGTGGMRWAALGRVQGSNLNWFMDEEKVSKAVAAIAGLKWEKGVGTDFYSIEVSKDANSVFLLGRLIDRRKDFMQRHFVVKLNLNGELVSSYGTKGVAFIGGSKYWMKNVSESSGPEMTMILDGQLVIRTYENNKESYTKASKLVLLKADGREDVKFNEAITKSSEIANLKWFDYQGSLVSDGKGNGLLFFSAYDTGRKMVYIKFNVKGEVDSNFARDIYQNPVMKMCLVYDAAAIEGGWLVSGSCDKVYYVWKLKSDGSFDSSFGRSGESSSKEWQKEMKSDFDLRSLYVIGDRIGLLPDGRMLVPFMWQGKLTGTYQGGHFLLKADGHLDTSFAMRGLVSTPLGKNQSRGTQQFFMQGQQPYSLAVSSEGSTEGVLVQRYQK